MWRIDYKNEHIYSRDDVHVHVHVSSIAMQCHLDFRCEKRWPLLTLGLVLGLMLLTFKISISPLLGYRLTHLLHV